MSPRQMHWNRREEARYICQNRRVSWQRGGRKRRNGMLFDVSSTGLAFVTDTLRAPNVGDEVEINIHPGSQTMLCRVMRVTAQNRDEALVGCRRDPANAVGLSPNPRIHLKVRRSAGKERMRGPVSVAA